MDDTAGLTIGEIRSKCRRLASTKEGLALIVIDYLQLITGSAKNANNRQQEVSEISRGLKMMAMEVITELLKDCNANEVFKEQSNQEQTSKVKKVDIV